MKSIEKISFFLLCGVLTLSVLPAQEKAKLKLLDQYRKWLEEDVAYIITPRERDVFRKLETDRERDIFIEAFWKQRDPTPGTARNEFRDEHYRRLNYANEFFGRGTPRPGWMTDQGHVYIVLGPPLNVEKYDAVMNVYPTEIWFYLGDPALGLPTAFHIIFFKKEGSGEYIMYVPADHGPQSLIADYLGDAKDVMDAYLRLAKLAPNLAPHTLSLIPGERVPLGAVSLASTTLLSTVFSSPQKKVEDKWAEALLKYKDIVEVDYSANYISSDAFLSVIKDKSGIFFVHYSVEPKKISVDTYGSRYSVNFELDGRLSDAKGNTVFQYTKEIPLAFNSDQLKDVTAKALAIQDMFPLVPGSYRFDLLIKNTVSKEFTSFGGTVAVPEEVSRLFLTPLVLGHKVEKGGAEAGDFVPFRTPAGQIICQARKTFARKETLYIFLQALGLTPELRSAGRLKVEFLRQDSHFLTKTIEIVEINSPPDILLEFPLGDFPPDYYKIKIAFLDGKGAQLATEDENFEVTAAAEVPRPLVFSKVMPASRAEEYDYIMGVQWLSLGRTQEARDFLEKAYRRNPNDLKYALGFSQSLYMNKDFGRAKEILSPFVGERTTDQVLYFLGKSSHALEQYSEAAAFYREYLSRFGLNLEVLNLLGMACYRMGDRNGALEAWRKSLEVSPGQEDIKKLLQSITEKK
ncbi:MAG: GWxTD domain-containing protein [Clostridiales bacterium]|nr:GWxTD domain-containing protein [Clostridiales bacterium]